MRISDWSSDVCSSDLGPSIWALGDSGIACQNHPVPICSGQAGKMFEADLPNSWFKEVMAVDETRSARQAGQRRLQTCIVALVGNMPQIGARMAQGHGSAIAAPHGKHPAGPARRRAPEEAHEPPQDPQ